MLLYQFYVSEMNCIGIRNLNIIVSRDSFFSLLQIFGIQYLLLRIKILHPKVLVPDKYVVVGRYNVRMQKTFGIPPWTSFTSK